MLIKSDSTISLRVGDPIQSLKILRSHEVMKDMSMRHSIDIIQENLILDVKDISRDDTGSTDLRIHMVYRKNIRR
jgi:hypothetical protein